MNKLIVGLVLMLTGCVSMRSHMSHLREGMDRQEVINELGQPDGMKRTPEGEWIVYANRTLNTWGVKDRADFYVLLKEGKVAAYGNGDVRPGQQENVSWVIPINTQPPVQPLPAPPPDYFKRR